MALANVACLLARRGKRVLCVDWDLDAPGLHRFFQPYSSGARGTLEFDEWTASTPGLIELQEELYRTALSAGSPASEDLVASFEDVDLSWYCFPTDIRDLWFLRAGRLDLEYDKRVAAIDWQARYAQCPGLFQAFGERLTRDFEYVLIDSRTGVSDIGGICTALMPEKLVSVFTPTAQSIEGGLVVINSAARFRLGSDDLRSYIVYPLPSRIEASEQDLRRAWLSRYQQEFERMFQRLYGLDYCDLSRYFGEVQIPHVARYAYGEEIAALIEKEGDRLSLSSSYAVFTRWLTDVVPWEVGTRAG
jgi:hypothetical protein